MVSALSLLNTKVNTQLAVNFFRNPRFLLSACRSCILRRQWSNFVLQNASRPLPQLSSRQLSVTLIQARQKSAWDKQERESDSDSDDEEFMSREKAKVRGAKVLQVQVDSLRADNVLKHGLGMARNKVDVMFYEGRIRVNGRKIKKKSQNTNLEDEVDLIKERSPDNPELLIISRVELLKARPSGDIILLTVRRHKNLLVPNYEEDPWEEPEPKPGTSKDNKDEIEKYLS